MLLLNNFIDAAVVSNEPLNKVNVYAASCRDSRPVNVFLPNQAPHSRPQFTVELATAEEWVSYGVAEWINARGRSIRLRRATGPADIRDQSCHIGPGIMRANANDQLWARAIVDGWQFHPLPIAQAEVCHAD